MFTEYYKAVSLDTILTGTEPGVALFVKYGSNYVLLKGPGQPFSENDKARLINNNTLELHVFSGELSNYNRYIEANLPIFLADESLPPAKQQEILCQAAVNYSQEMFNTPSKYLAQNINRCRFLTDHLINHGFNLLDLHETLCRLVKCNYYTYVHSVQVSVMSAALHDHLLQPDMAELVELGVASMFHDYGKIYIPEEILDKTDRLTPFEYYEIKKHCDYGYDLLKMLDVFNSSSLGIIRSHHEKINGKGYPEGLRGDDIDRSAKIAAIADVYCAITTNKTYGKAYDRETALDVMNNEMDGSFDLKYLQLLNELLGE